MSNSQDVKMDEAMTDVKQEDGPEPSAVPVGSCLDREKDADKDMVSSEEAAVDKGPHHEAQKSTITGFSLLASTTSCMKVASDTSLITDPSIFCSNSSIITSVTSYFFI